ncbi:SDR family oxidoreductase [Halomonas alkaliantarctica]|uniref:SDR family oxidoreductase n=1 Tax=Halomonas alkaliantarctica TaxID=232346 RepID=A0ABY8LHV5_9GAMM|nr:SDR family NAD(P)-dependent oxidoreductase [Halomonas alkaliantarctica]WGI24041.1 SDR family oxidoreductase [Halomonas alkaliantarctica]
MNIKNKVIAITGGASGLGYAMAERLGEQGAVLALMDKSAATLDEAISKLAVQGINAHGFPLDVADKHSVTKAFADIADRLGPIDGCVNNAGITDDALLLKVKDGVVAKRMSLDAWQRVIDVNLTGVFLCGREAAGQMVESGKGGVIVNISSISRAGNMGQTNYAAAKAGVHALTVTWAKELAKYSIRTATVAPGFIDTPMTATMRPDMYEKIAGSVPLKRLGEADNIAQCVAFIVENDYFTGRIIECDGGLRM